MPGNQNELDRRVWLVSEEVRAAKFSIRGIENSRRKPWQWPDPPFFPIKTDMKEGQGGETCASQTLPVRPCPDGGLRFANRALRFLLRFSGEAAAGGQTKQP